MVASVNPRAAGVTAVPSVTWAELRALNPASYNPSQIFHVTDVGVGGSYWYSNGVRWRPVNGACWLYNLPADVAHPGTSGTSSTATRMADFLIPAGLIQDGDMIEVHASIDASAVGDTATNYFRLGTSRTAADASLGSYAQPSGASNLLGSTNKRYRRKSATTLRILDAVGATGLGISSTTALQAFTVPDMDTTAQYLGFYTHETTGGVRVCTLRNLAVELIAGA